MAGRRRDSKHRVLRRGESIRADGKYQFKYHVNGTPHFVYSWRLEPTDKLPARKKPPHQEPLYNQRNSHSLRFNFQEKIFQIFHLCKFRQKESQTFVNSHKCPAFLMECFP